MKRGQNFILSVLSVVFFLCGIALADENTRSTPWNRTNIRLGGFLATLGSDVQIGIQEIGTGIIIDTEDALGLDSTMTVFRVEATQRLGDSRRHTVEFTYFDFRRSSRKVLLEEITIDDKTFPVGAQVQSQFNLSIIKAKYRYSVFQDDRFDLGFGLGAYIMPIKFEVGSSRLERFGESITAPLPVFSTNLDFAVTPKLCLRQNIDVLYLAIGDFRGGIIDTGFGVEYKIWKHAAIGLGYNMFRLAIEANGEDYPAVDLIGKLTYGYSGLQLYANLFF